ncbi:hypothetical protein [Tuwongella immobilis]|uniref:Uncharacterized protein n=1 Tax=Tuwongella immobilis TaxID=692036 RepID=A0A6C2YT06_9BACT|nr:hypothetical protein [Tuwongella immobilis]VIP04868.1 Putative uncharacterized protein OS=uncultured planctomycete GN=HGMM_F11G08C16 PE=4 SV=1 [Tuwongella immobilis]VTS07095.1 Putative uncharacterized protein OS=uncultured planctomycete GN=HGMM_F11G08C16 PE=4 SV=1 [Tuwongella immobilis]
MAFNPFSAFRKYFKPMMAALAVMCMFIFVLSSGLGNGGDFFDQLPRWLNKGARGPTIATIYGQNYDSERIEQVRRERQFVSDYMSSLMPLAELSLLSELKTDGLNKLSDEVKATLRPIVEMRLSMLQNENADPRQNQMLFFQYFQSMQQSLPRLQAMLSTKQSALESENSPSETVQRDIDAINGVLQVMTYDSKAFSRSNFFESVPNDTTRFVLEFLLWDTKAVEMGISLEPTDVRKEMLRDLLGRTPDPKLHGVLLQGLAMRYPDIPTSRLTELLNREYRVRIAQASLIGSTFFNRTQVTTPTFATAQEWFRFYKDVCSQTSYFAFSLPVSHFVSKVTETPTTEDLQKIFEAFKSQEPDPARETPGFKQPRRIQVAWLGGSTNQEHYRTRAPQLLKAQIAASQIATALTVPVGGSAFPAPITTVAAIQTGDAPLLGLYDEYLSRRFPWNDAITPRLRDTSVIRPTTIASLVSQSVVAALTQAPVITGILTMEQQAIAAEVRDRVRVGMPAVLAPLSAPTPLMWALPLHGLTTPATILHALPGDLPFAALRGRFRERLESDLLGKLMISDLTEFQTEIAKLAKDRAPAIADVYVEEFVKQRGLKSGRMTGLADRFSISNEPALLPLKDHFTSGHGGQLRGAANFGEFFFNDQSSFGQSTPASATYDARWYPNNQPPSMVVPNQQLFLAWRTEDTPPKTLTFDEAKPQVIAAWKFDKARDLAEKAAKALADEAKAIASDKAKLRDLGDRVKREYTGTWFEIGPVAELNQDPSLSPDSGITFSPYSLPFDVNSPRTDTVQKLLGIKDKPIGESITFTNVPSDTVYLAMLVGKAEKKESDFYEVYASLNKFGVPNQFAEQFLRKQAAQVYQMVTNQLREEAKYTEDKETIEKRVQDELKNLR